MKHKAISAAVALLASAALLVGCGTLPAEAPLKRVSPDYLGAGDTQGIRPMVYGARTVLQFDSLPAFVRVVDENGVQVPFERVGKYVRVARKLGTFEVWFNMAHARFEPAPASAPQPADQARASTAAPAAASTPASPAPAVLKVERQASDADQLLAIASKQLEEVRTVIGSDTNPAEAKALAAKLDRIEAQVLQAATVIVRMQFESAKSTLVVSPEVERVLIPAAQAAERINVRGRTDAVVPGPDDPKIALGRALAARQYLVERGVSADKIKVFSLAAGDRIAPAGMEQGRALNRRVDIELVNRRFAELRRQSLALASRGSS